MSKITLINASCADEAVDAVVNAANMHLAAGGGICGAIFKKAGYEELKNACDKIQTPLPSGAAVITPAFKIENAKAIIHAVGPNFAITPNALDKLFNAYYNSLLILKDNNFHSISFPLISSGIFAGSLENAAEISAKECLKAYNEFLKNYPNYNIFVKLCAYTKDEMAQAEKAFKA